MNLKIFTKNIEEQAINQINELIDIVNELKRDK